MCHRENASLQRGMNYRLSTQHSVVLMSVQPNSPYNDKIIEDGAVLIYEGHDEPKTAHTPEPKRCDQPETNENGKLTQNGKFHRAAQLAKDGERSAEAVRVYEKIRKGIWSYNGCFLLTDSWTQNDGIRNVFKFRLEATSEMLRSDSTSNELAPEEPNRIIPTSVKQEVWKRDGGAA